MISTFSCDIVGAVSRYSPSPAATRTCWSRAERHALTGAWGSSRWASPVPAANPH